MIELGNIGVFQNAFVQERNIGDNIMIAQEVLSVINSHKRGKEGRIALKIDMSKAYDRLSWNFLRLTLMKMGFPNQWISLIMECVTTVSYELMINGCPGNNFIPSCGIRQGDPISPYLFVLCTEILSHNMVRAQDLRGLKGVKISRNAPEISHIFFADDSLFFIQGNNDAVNCLKDILDVYCAASGQRVNNEKSTICFSPSCNLNLIKNTLKEFKIKPSLGMGKYLGAPMNVGTLRSAGFRFLIDKVKDRISSWNGMFLSPAGRLTLIQSILSSISVYFLSVFKIPVSVAKKINSLLAHFWWVGVKDSRGMHWCSMNLLSVPKSRGGLGIRNVICLNQAMLAKQTWRILSCTDTLLSRLFIAKYGSLLDESGGTVRALDGKGSWTWKGIVWGWKLLRPNLAWKIGWDSKVKVWSEKWIQGTIPVPKTNVNHNNLWNWEVGSLMKEGKEWNRDCIREVFSNEWMEKIMSIPLTMKRSQDTFYWDKTISGSYDIKSGYGLALDAFLAGKLTNRDMRRGNSSFRDFYRKLWKLPGPGKWKILLWKILNCCLPVGEEFRRRNMDISNGCVLCLQENVEESYDHLFRDCIFAKHLWFGSDLGIRVSNLECCQVQVWVCNWLTFMGKMDTKDVKGTTWMQIQFLGVLWSIWIARNEAKFKGKTPSWKDYIFIYKYLVTEMFEAENKKRERMVQMIAASHKENPNGDQDDVEFGYSLAGQSICTEHGKLKVDATWLQNGKSTAGWLLQQSCWILKGTCSFRAESALQAEALGIKEAMMWAVKGKFLHLVVYTDCLKIVKQIKQPDAADHAVATILFDLLELAKLFHCFSLCFTPRSEMTDAHNLARSVMHR